MLVKILKEVPDEVFVPALSEINNIQWENIHDTIRAKHNIFSTSSSIPLRRHALAKNRPEPKTIAEWCMICECENNPVFNGQFASVRSLADWVLTYVNGIALGRMMIVNLKPYGTVDLHIDPNAYFEYYSRFHVPFRTNPNVVFHSGPDTLLEHMPYKKLCQLNNRSIHGLTNNSNEYRIHLIVDIAVEGGNQIF
jgi:hypothetical protein